VIDAMLTTGDQIAVVLVAAVGLSTLASLLILIADRPWRRVDEPADTMVIHRVALDDTRPLPPLVVDSPPSMRGTRPSILGVPAVRIPACSLCRDGLDVVGTGCAWCGHTAQEVRS
jgi:hypothetical protein